MSFTKSGLNCLNLALLFCLFFVSPSVFATAKYNEIVILHTADLHSHFTNRESPRRLGGYARLKTEIDNLRRENPNSLLLDAGDWSEGSLFFTLNSGEASQRMMEAFGYDAIVLGNHDWLVGPKELYESFLASGIKIPVLSANMNMAALPKNIPLQNFITPYVVKIVNGKRVGIFGLSTYQFLYDHFFAPVYPTEPIFPARRMVKYLRQTLKCDVVIALTHLGEDSDKIIAKTVGGIDLIVGGHTHILYKQPLYVSGTPIVHAGLWGQHIGEYHLAIDLQGKVNLVDHKIHQIDETLPEDPSVKIMVDDFQTAIEKQFGTDIFKKIIAQSEVGLREVRTDPFSNDFLGNVTADAIREVGHTEVAFDSAMFSSTQLFSGSISLADIFNLFPHIYSKQTNDSWTIYTYKVKGYMIRLLAGLMARYQVGVKMSNAQLIVDGARKNKIVSLKIGGQEVEYFRDYSVSSTQGIVDVFNQIRSYHLPIGPKEFVNTGKVMWREVARKLSEISPITADKIKWEGRTRTLQPDPSINKEFITLKQVGNRIAISLKVVNAGMQSCPVPQLEVKVDSTPHDSVDERWASVPMIRKSFQSILQPGDSIDFEGFVQVDSEIGFLPITATIAPVFGETSLTNNTVTNDVEYLPGLMAGGGLYAR